MSNDKQQSAGAPMQRSEFERLVWSLWEKDGKPQLNMHSYLQGAIVMDRHHREQAPAILSNDEVIPGDDLCWIGEHARIGQRGSAHRYIKGAIDMYHRMAKRIIFLQGTAKGYLMALATMQDTKARLDNEISTLTKQRDQAIDELAELKLSFHQGIEITKERGAEVKKLQEEASECRKALELLNFDPLNYSVQQMAEGVLLKYPSPDAK